MSTINLKNNNFKNYMKNFFPLNNSGLYKLQKIMKIKLGDVCNFLEQLQLLDDKVSLKSRATIEKDNFVEAAHIMEIDRLGLETEEPNYDQQMEEVHELQLTKEENETQQMEDEDDDKTQSNTFLFNTFVKTEHADIFVDTSSSYLKTQTLFYNYISFFDFFSKTKSMLLNNLVLVNNYKPSQIKKANKSKHLHTIILNATTRNFYITLLTPEKTKVNDVKVKRESTALLNLLNTKYKIKIADKKVKGKKNMLIKKRTVKTKRRIVLITLSLGLTGFKTKKVKRQPFVLKLLIFYIKNYLAIYSQRYFILNKVEPNFSIILKTSLTNLRIKLVLFELLTYLKNDNTFFSET